MLAVPSSANSPTTLSLLPSVLAVATPDMVSTRVTPVALPAPLSDEPVADNVQSNTTAPPPAVIESMVTAATAASGASGTLASNLSTGGPSASFLAQLLGQSDEEEDSAASLATYARFAPAPEYNTFVGYSFIKYMPSDAGLPPQRSPLPAAVTPYTPPAEPLAESAPVVSQNSQDTVAVVPAQVTALVGTPAPPVQNNTPASAGFANDFQAYSQTQSRNQSNLSFAQPQIIVAG